MHSLQWDNVNINIVTLSKFAVVQQFWLSEKSLLMQLHCISFETMNIICNIVEECIG